MHPGGRSNRAGTQKHLTSKLVGLTLLLLACDIAGGSHCDQDLAVGTSFQLNLTCQLSLLQGNLKFTGDNSILDYTYVTAKIYCTTSNGTEGLYNMLDHAGLNKNAINKLFLHNLPPGSHCVLVGCYSRYFPTFGSFAMQNSSCTISNHPGVTPAIVHSSVPFLPSLSPSPILSISSGSSITSYLSKFHSQYYSPHYPDSTKPPVFSSLTTANTNNIPLSTQIPSPSHQAPSSPNDPVSHIIVAITAFVCLTVVVVSCLAVALLQLRNSHTQTRKIDKIGEDNWRNEVLESNYNPIDLSKKSTAFFLSQESVIDSLCDSHGCFDSASAAVVPGKPQHSSENCTEAFCLEYGKSCTPKETITEVGIGVEECTSRTSTREKTQGTCKFCDSSDNDILPSSENTSGYGTSCYTNNLELMTVPIQSSSEAIFSVCESNQTILQSEHRASVSDRRSRAVWISDPVDMTCEQNQDQHEIMHGSLAISVLSPRSTCKSVECSSDLHVVQNCSSKLTSLYTTLHLSCENMHELQTAKEKVGSEQKQLNNPHQSRNTQVKKCINDGNHQGKHTEADIDQRLDMHKGTFTFGVHSTSLHEAYEKKPAEIKEDVANTTASDVCTPLTFCEKMDSKTTTEEAQDHKAQVSAETDGKFADVVSFSTETHPHNASTSASICTSESLTDYDGYIHMESPL